MGIKTRLLGLAMGVAAASAGALLPASAATVGVLAFDGTTSSVTCSGATVGCPGGSGIPYVGGGGSYVFATHTIAPAEVVPAFCIQAGINTGPSVYVSSVPRGCTISSNGSYTNIVCGTGTANGTATVTNTGATVNVGGNPVVADNGYTIIFVAGIGVYSSTKVVFSGGQVGVGVGVVVLQPDDTGGAPGTGGPCVFNFDVVGAIVGAETA